MKKIVFAITFLAGISFYQQADAQVRVNINIGSQPIWGPTGYDYAQYYYLPEMDVYYDIANRVYYYPSGRRWVSSATLPARYRRYNMYNTYKVVVNENRPWLRNQQMRSKYASYSNRHDQGNIRDSRDTRYWENVQHPHHNDWVRDHNNTNNGRPQREGQGSNNGRGRDRRR